MSDLREAAVATADGAHRARVHAAAERLSARPEGRVALPSAPALPVAPRLETRTALMRAHSSIPQAVITAQAAGMRAWCAHALQQRTPAFRAFPHALRAPACSTV
jgi:hypothetical protein